LLRENQACLSSLPLAGQEERRARLGLGILADDRRVAASKHRGEEELERRSEMSLRRQKNPIALLGWLSACGLVRARD
jgi:hypothetical protein